MIRVRDLQAMARRHGNENCARSPTGGPTSAGGLAESASGAAIAVRTWCSARAPGSHSTGCRCPPAPGRAGCRARRSVFDSAEVDLVQPVAEHRAGRNQRHRRRAGCARRQVAAERRRDLRVGGRVARGDLRTGQALEHGARLETPPRQRVDAKDLDLRLERRRHVAVQQILRGIDNEAVVRIDASGARATRERQYRAAAGR